MDRQPNAATVALIKAFEERRLTTYDDANPHRVLKRGDKVWGTLTIGWGHTGPDVVIGRTITEAEAQQLFDHDVGGTVTTVSRTVKVVLTGNQFGALVSFAFNVGDQAFVESTLLAQLNEGHFDAVPTELQKWNKTTEGGQKVVSKGLIRRRAAEVNLWASAADPETMATGERGNQVGEPPAAKPIVTDAVVTGGAVAGVGAFLSDAARQVEPLVPYGDTIKWLFLALSLAAIGFVIWSRIRAIRHEAS